MTGTDRWRRLSVINQWLNRLDLPLWALTALVAILLLATGNVHGRARNAAASFAVFGIVRILVRGTYLWANRDRQPPPR